ncbi:MAG TPA: chemotaxis protein CheB [Kofleriaceae bacterium]|nr:chemotaxis protein CheB [Kofleriaceae bacterium]
MKLAIVHGGLTAIDMVRRALSTDREVEILWTAGDSTRAMAQARQERPEAALVSASLDRAAVLVRVLTDELDCPVIVLSDGSSTAKAGTFELMSAGAVDVIVLPGLASGTGDAAAVRGKLALLRRLAGRDNASHKSVPPMRAAPIRPAIIAIGASTGGPQALATVLAALPAQLEAAVLIVQHIDPQFSEGMAQWLARSTPFTVELATQGVQPRGGVVYVAAVGQHMVVETDGTLAFTSRPREAAHKPSIDVLFTSLIKRSRPGVAVLLTGMGRDGAQGLAQLRAAGWRTIAQDEATSVVYGMPKAAAELKAAAHVLPLPQIGPAIVRLVEELDRPPPRPA